jgi:hypothetical protein
MRSVAILTGPATHLDHLGVLSHLLRIPLVVTDASLCTAAKNFYPNLQPELKEFDALSIEYLCAHYDTIFETGKFFAAELKPFMRLLHQKEMRFIFCPHGNSDKGHSLSEHVEQDLFLVYGEHLKALLENNGALKKIGNIARTGNYRLGYYLEHQRFFDDLAAEKVFRHFKEDRPIVLYAPTWSDKENPSSFFRTIDRLAEELSPVYNLLVKLHPLMMEDSLAYTYAILAKYENHPSVFFLTDFPPIYPLLAKSQMYIGDYSSIGYDFLAFDRPLYFIQRQASPLAACGRILPEKGIKKFIDESWEEAIRSLSSQRKELYQFAFGKSLTAKEIRKEIFEMGLNISEPRP